jgi:hypothetical protein
MPYLFFIFDLYAVAEQAFVELYNSEHKIIEKFYF